MYKLKRSHEMGIDVFNISRTLYAEKKEFITEFIETFGYIKKLRLMYSTSTYINREGELRHSRASTLREFFLDNQTNIKAIYVNGNSNPIFLGWRDDWEHTYDAISLMADIKEEDVREAQINEFISECRRRVCCQ